VDIPEELEPVWDAKIEETFRALTPKQQDFVIAYLQTGSATKAYRKAYNPNAGQHLAENCGAQVMGGKGVGTVLMAFEDQKTHDLFLCIKTLREMAEATKPQWQQDKDGQWENAGDVPDWQARKSAVDGLSKIRGLNAAEKKEISGTVTIQSTPQDEAL
jgi:hypothetical protein